MSRHKLEVITALFKDQNGNQYESLQQDYTVNWAVELGQGTFGKVYVGTNGSATDTADMSTADEDIAGK